MRVRCTKVQNVNIQLNGFGSMKGELVRFLVSYGPQLRRLNFDVLCYIPSLCSQLVKHCPNAIGYNEVYVHENCMESFSIFASRIENLYFASYGQTTLVKSAQFLTAMSDCRKTSKISIVGLPLSTACHILAACSCSPIVELNLQICNDWEETYVSTLNHFLIHCFYFSPMHLTLTLWYSALNFDSNTV